MVMSDFKTLTFRQFFLYFQKIPIYYSSVFVVQDNFFLFRPFRFDTWVYISNTSEPIFFHISGLSRIVRTRHPMAYMYRTHIYIPLNMQKFDLKLLFSRSLADLQILACQPFFLYLNFMCNSFIVSTAYYTLDASDGISLINNKLLLVLDVWHLKPTYRKSWAANLLMW